MKLRIFTVAIAIGSACVAADRDDPTVEEGVTCSGTSSKQVETCAMAVVNESDRATFDGAQPVSNGVTDRSVASAPFL